MYKEHDKEIRIDHNDSIVDTYQFVIDHFEKYTKSYSSPQQLKIHKSAYNIFLMSLNLTFDDPVSIQFIHDFEILIAKSISADVLRMSTEDRC